MGTAVDGVGGRASVAFLMDRTLDTVALFGVQREDYTFAPPTTTRDCGSAAIRDIIGGRPSMRWSGWPPGSWTSARSSRHLPLEWYGEGVDLLERQEAVKVCFHPWP